MSRRLSAGGCPERLGRPQGYSLGHEAGGGAGHRGDDDGGGRRLARGKRRREGREGRLAPADDDRQSRLFELDLSPAAASGLPLSDDDVASVVRGLISGATERGQRLEVIGVSPGAALAFPDDPRISVRPVQRVSFSLPSSPAGLILRMDEEGDGHVWALTNERVPLGSEGMWWIVTLLIDALELPDVVSRWPRS